MRWSSFTAELRQKWLILAVAMVAALTGVTLYLLGTLQPLQSAAIDENFVIEGAHRPPGNIVIIAVDDATLQHIDAQLPIPRSYYARLLDLLHPAHPELVALDLQFIGTSPDGQQDRALLAAFARDGPVLLSITDTGQGVPAIAGIHNPAGVVTGSGAVDADSDGVIRKMLYVQVRQQTFAIRAAEMVRGRAISASRAPDNHAWIDFAGPPGTYRTYSLDDVLDGAVPSSAFTGKVVLVGVTAPIAKDVFVTSASSKPMAGVEVQANALETALRGFPLHSSGPVVSWGLIIALALLPALLGLSRSSLLVAFSAIALAGLYLVIVHLAFTHGLILPAPYPIVALGVATCGVVAVDAVTERRKRRSLENVLQEYLRPARYAFFISYRRDQSSFAATSLRSALAARFGESSVFMDVTAINPGQQWPQEIQEAILGCSAMLVIISPQWLAATDARSGARRLDDPEDWVRKEVEAGLARPEVAVIPVLVEGATMPHESELPDSLRPLSLRNAFPLTGANLDQEVDTLVAGLHRGHLRPRRRASAGAGDPAAGAGEVRLADRTRG
jgi:CHASE2 domain-containing sensor protein